MYTETADLDRKKLKQREIYESPKSKSAKLGYSTIQPSRT